MAKKSGGGGKLYANLRLEVLKEKLKTRLTAAMEEHSLALIASKLASAEEIDTMWDQFVDDLMGECGPPPSPPPTGS